MTCEANHDGCRTAPGISPEQRQPRFRREPGFLKSPDRIFPQIICRRFRIAGTFCRQRWFARYARSESLLCLPSFA